MTLTESIFWTKIGAKVGGVFLVILIIGYFAIALFFPAAPIPPEFIVPTQKCGELPVVNIKELGFVDTSKVTIRNESSAASLPDLVRIVNVYEYDVPGQNFNSLQQAQSVAQKLGFTPENVSRPDADTYRWSDLFQNRTLTVDASNINFELFREPASVPSVSTALPSVLDAPRLVRTYLQRLELYNNEYTEREAEVFLVDIQNGKISEAQSLNEAKMVRVDLLREVLALQIEARYYRDSEIGAETRKKLLNERVREITKNGQRVSVKDLNADVVTDFPYGGNIQVYINATQDDRGNISYNYPIISYTDWRIKAEPCGTYLLKQPTAALQEIQRGEGKLVFLTDKVGKDIGDRLNPPALPAVSSFNVTDVKLAYLDKKEKQRFLQPIYMVSGEAVFVDQRKGQFVYYVPAIRY